MTAHRLATQAVRLALSIALLLPAIVVAETLAGNSLPGVDEPASVEAAPAAGAGYSAIVDVNVVGYDRVPANTQGACGSASTEARGWFWDQTDLNASAGGDYVYLCYRIGDAADAITNVTVRTTCPTGFTAKGVNLNKNAGGNYLRLCIKKGGTDPLLGIGITRSCAACDPPCPVDTYARGIRTDLNLGAGGETQYFCLTFASTVDSFTRCGGLFEKPCDHPAAFPDCDRGLQENSQGNCANDERRSSDSDYLGYFNTWEFQMYRMQRDRISRDAPFTDVMYLEAHNSYANNNDGMDSLYNQTYSITDQLRAGARVVELDVHHDSGETNPNYDGCLGAGDSCGFRPLEVYHESIEGVGVNQYYRYVHDALKEIRDWMLLNPDQVVIVNLEQYVGRWGGTVLSYLVDTYLGDRAGIGVLDSHDFQHRYAGDATKTSDDRVPSAAELVANGDRVVVLANNTTTGLAPLTTSNGTKAEGLLGLPRFPILERGTFVQTNKSLSSVVDDSSGLTTCREAVGDEPTSTFKRLVRVYPSLTNQGSAAQIDFLARCGVTIMAIDDFLCPDAGCDYDDDLDRLDAYVWSWEDDHWPATNSAAAMQSSGRWRSASPTNDYRYACRTTLGSMVLASAPSGPFTGGVEACRADGHTFSHPRTHWENAELKAAAGGARVWLNFTNLFDARWRPESLSIDATYVSAPTTATRRIAWVASSTADLVPGWPADTTNQSNVQPSCGVGSGGTPAVLLTGSEVIADDGNGSWSGAFECWFPPGESGFEAGVTLTNPVGSTATATTTVFPTARPNAAPEISAVERVKLTNIIGTRRAVSIEVRDLDPGETVNVLVEWGDGLTNSASIPTSPTFSTAFPRRFIQDPRPWTTLGDQTVTVHASNGTPTPGAPGTTTKTGTVQVSPRPVPTPPIVTPSPAVPTVVKGASTQLSWTVADSYDIDFLTGEIDWGDGSPVTPLTGAELKTGTVTRSKTYASSGEFTATVQVEDTREGLTTTREQDVEVTNAPPSIESVVVEPGTVLVGTDVDLTVTASDPNPGDPLEAWVTWPGTSETGPFPLVSGSVTVSDQVAALGPPVAVRVVDGDGAEARVTRFLTSGDVVFLDATWADEQRPATFTGRVRGGQGVASLAVDWDDGSPIEIVPLLPYDAACDCHPIEIEHTYADGSETRADSELADEYDPTIEALDGGAATIGSDTANVKVFESAPVITSFSDQHTVDVGEALVINGEFLDGTIDQHVAIAWHVESDDDLAAVITDQVNDTFTVTVPGVYEPGIYQINARVRVDLGLAGFGEFSPIVSAEVTVVAPPEIEVDDVAGEEGDEVVIPVRIPMHQTSLDPSYLILQVSDGQSFDVLDNEFPDIDPVCQCLSIDFPMTFADDGAYTATASYYDADATLVQDVASITVTDVDPTIAVDAPRIVPTDTPFALGISVGDVPADAHTLTFTDNGAPMPAALTDLGGGSWTADVAITSEGDHEIAVIATDTEGDLPPTQEVVTVVAGTATTASSGPPSITITPAPGTKNPTTSNQVVFDVVADRPVIGLTIDDLMLDGTAGGAVTDLSGGPVAYTATVDVSGVEGSLLAWVRADAVVDVLGQGNPATEGALVDVDRTKPTPAVDLPPGGAYDVDRTPIQIGVDFGEPVTGFTASDVTTSGTAKPTGVRVSGGPRVYVVEVATVAGPGTIDVAVEAGSVTDLAGNTNTTALQLGPGFTFGSGIAGIVPTAPARHWDSRDEPTVDGQFRGTARLGPQQTQRVQITGRDEIPDDAIGVVANLTGIFPDGPGFATMFACTDDVPVASHLNYQPGDIVANNAVVPLDAAGGVCVYTLAAADFALDVNGYVPADSPVTMLEPTRLLDTRPGEPTLDGASQGTGRNASGETITVPIAGRGGVPTTADAVFANLTVVGADALGFATLHPCGDLPGTSTLNFPTASPTPNGAVAKLSPDGELCIFTNVAAHLVMDVGGYVGDTGRLVTLVPGRVLDSRDEPTIDGESRNLGRVAAGEHLEVRVAGRAGVPADATAAVLNVVTVFPVGAGFVTLYPCGERPLTSNLNHAVGGGVRANNAITKLSPDGTVCLFTLSEADLVLDVNGWLR